MAKSQTKTPMMEQYMAIKAKHQDAVLFFRLGDFYEMFFDDAKIASEVLGITLTARGHGKGTRVPLAGFPYHSLDTYLSKMVKAGYRVAICEQVEDPKKAKTVVKRDVTEVVSPGTVLADDLLESKRNNFLGAAYFDGEVCGFAVVDVSTGEFTTEEVPAAEFVEALLKAGPSELLISEEQAGVIESRLPTDQNIFITKREDWIFSRDYAYETLTRHFGTLSLKGFGCETLNAGVSAAGAILHFLKEVQKYQLVHINELQRQTSVQFMNLDSDTRRNLELLRSMRGGTSHGTLISVMDKTKTAMGARRLVQWMLRPLLDSDQIQRRLDSVEEFIASASRLSELRQALGQIGDLERFISKIVTNRASARDLVALKKSLERIPEMRELLAQVESAELQNVREQLDDLSNLSAEIGKALVDDPPLAVTEGGIIRRGYHQELDDLHDIAYSGKDWIARLQTDEREKTGIPSLKIGYNKIFGYYIEVTKANLAKVPEYYIRKQTLVNAERYITPDLKEYEEKVLEAEEKIVSIEYELFDKLRKLTADESPAIQKNARLISVLDCLAGFAQLAVENKYIRPDINDGTVINIKDGRHPVVEKLLPYGESFIPNDTHLDNSKDQVIILTGPNMAGKSTFLRQVGLIVLQAQMGSFVPAKRVQIGVVDKIFTRVGASDNLAGGESTFLVEMNETANILNNATTRSLILLDEIGRGTSTFDGLSIAWAVAEHLHNTSKVAAKSIFATHYHELTELALILPRVRNYNVVVKEWGDKVVFLRKIAAGACDHSYGIQVAKLAGLPDSVIKRASEILSNLEADELTASNVPKLAVHKNGREEPRSNQLSIFEEQENHIRDEVGKLDLDQMTPLEAMLKLNELKKMVKSG
ncbi:MAG: DNA mismatch repair protein MutS [Calditrichaeota bacterium]|nr:DNA mismatch repair protein MutS [Calditrichota bacterium]